MNSPTPDMHARVARMSRMEIGSLRVSHARIAVNAGPVKKIAGGFLGGGFQGFH